MDSHVLIAMSAMSDGSMSKAVTDEERLKNRSRFLRQYSLTPSQAVLVHLSYDTTDFRRYYTIGTDQAGDGITYPSSILADALFTQSKNLALLLPVADCIGVVIYDPTNQALGLAHLGRHNLLQSGGTGIIAYMVDEFGSRPSDLQLWLSPAAGRENYPLHDFDNRSLHEVALEQLLAAGVGSEQIAIDSRDTTMDEAFFSHSEFLKGNRVTDGRQAVIAMIKP